MNQTLSYNATARALRMFIYSGALWGAWGKVFGIGTAVFTGYVLWLGATDAQVAYFVSIASFASLGQIVSSLIAPRVKRKKLLVFCVGMLEMLLRFAVVLAPLVASGDQTIWFVSAVLGFALFCGHIVSPIYNDWMASVIPEEIRARFIGRRTMVNLLSGMIAAYAAGRYVDLFSDDTLYPAFFAAFAVATAFGIAGYVNLMRVPFQGQEVHVPGNLWRPFQDRPFLKLLIFSVLWHFALGLSSPFYSVFMLRVLQIDYAMVAVFNSLFMGSMVVGYRVLGGLVDRFGGKAFLQILVPPCMITPILWVFNRPDFYWLIPCAMVINGLLHSGIMMSLNALLFGTLSEGRNKTTYFAAWSTVINMTYAIAPLIGSRLIGYLEPVQFTWFSVPVGNLQLSFLVTSVVLIAPLLALTAVSGQNQTSPGKLLGEIGRGNLLGYVYNSLVFDWAQSDQHRARAMRQMGRSRSPMALDRLIQALDDASPDVRRRAAQGLGEARSARAIEPLLEELQDEESDIRGEAAEALGKIGAPEVFDPLLDALENEDTRIRISAIRALSEMGSDEAVEVIFWKFADRFDRSTFPTLADVLGAARDLRMIRPTLERLRRFRAPAIRLQLLNSVCRALGARRRFYRLISLDNFERAERKDDMLRQTRRAFRRNRLLNASVRKDIVKMLDEMRTVFDEGDADQFLKHVGDFEDYLERNVDAKDIEALGAQSASRLGASALAMRTYLREVKQGESPEIQMLFFVVCLWCIGDAIDDKK